MQPVRLTKRSVDALLPPISGQKVLWDTEVRGFGVRILPSGTKTFIIQYRTAARVERRMKISPGERRWTIRADRSLEFGRIAPFRLASASSNIGNLSPQSLRAVRRFNLAHMNYGRNAYQASHSYSVADYTYWGREELVVICVGFGSAFHDRMRLALTLTDLGPHSGSAAAECNKVQAMPRYHRELRQNPTPEVQGIRYRRANAVVLRHLPPLPLRTPLAVRRVARWSSRMISSHDPIYSAWRTVGTMPSAA